MSVLNKEQIKDRLVKMTAEKWNVQESEVDANFDPLILLLFDALAFELEGVGQMIKDIQGSLLQELSGLMLPKALLNAKPASCIVSAMPNENSCIINPYITFSTTTQLQKTGEPVRDAEIHFTPIGSFQLLKLQPGHIIVGNRVYKFTADGRKTLLYEGSSQQLVQEIHFTLQNPTALTSLEGLQIFFDLKGHSQATDFYFALQQASLFINSTPARFVNGYFNAAQFDITLKEALSRNGDYSGKVQREVAGVYARQFISITSRDIPGNNGMAITALQQAPENIQKETDTPGTVYFTIKLVRPFAMEALERMQLGINTFPAINRSLQQVSFKTDRWVNILPLPVEGSYLDIEKVETIDGSKYRLYENAWDKELKGGEAIVRSARVSKSSSAEIRNTIQGLLTAIRDESAYFSRVSNDFVATRLTEISKILTRLEDQITLSKDEKPSFRYLLLKPLRQGENVQASYWTTDPPSAANIKAGQLFKPLKHTLTNNNATFSLTAATGGSSAPSNYAQRQMLVRQLSSGGKLISVEDIKLLCYEIFGNKLKQITIDKVMKVLPGRNTGISRVILIDIKVAAQQFPANELTYLENQLRYQLDTNASFVFPFEIRITES